LSGVHVPEDGIDTQDDAWPAVLASTLMSRSFHRHTLSPRDVELDEAVVVDSDVVRLVPPIASRGLDTGDVVGPYRLVIRLGTLRFNHHTLFSKVNR
jgi:hypothetical protein